MSLDDAPISEIYLTLNDSWRTISISGRDQSLVNGLLLLVKEEIGKFGCSLGGGDTRRFWGYVLFILANIFAWSPWILRRFPRFVGADSRNQIRIVSACSAIALGLFISVFALPWADWFPGIAIRKYSISTWELIGPYVTIASLLVGLVGLALSLVLFLGSRHGQSHD